jgi:hemerythrin HHE cation binding domain-containing protein
MTPDYKLDMTMMYAFHDALRRDLHQVSAMEARSDGWDLFEMLLHLHHTVEDDALWPVVRAAVEGRSDDLALLDEMAAEHAAIPPLLDAITAALGSGGSAPEARAELASKLAEHLQHEENATLPLIDATLTEEQWMTFGMTATQRVGPNMPKFLPWLLDGADDDMTARVLAIVPPPVADTYRAEWQPAYAAQDWWAVAPT